MSRRERGSTAVELAGMLPMLLLISLFAWQALMVAFTVTAAENAARSGSRAEGRGDDGREIALESLPTWLRGDAEVTVDGELVEVRIPVPIVLPGVSWGGATVARSAELPGTG